MQGFDWQQITFLILVVVVGFFRWLGSKAEERKAGQQDPQPDADELARREAAWRRQTGGPAAPKPERDPWAELRELFNPTPQPAPPPTVQRAPTPQAAAPPPLRAPAPQPPGAAPAPAAPKPVAPAAPPPTMVLHSRGTEDRAIHDLRQLLARPEGLRQAVLLREILGPPKALQSQHAPLI